MGKITAVAVLRGCMGEAVVRSPVDSELLRTALISLFSAMVCSQMASPQEWRAIQVGCRFRWWYFGIVCSSTKEKDVGQEGGPQARVYGLCW